MAMYQSKKVEGYSATIYKKKWPFDEQRGY